MEIKDVIARVLAERDATLEAVLPDWLDYSALASRIGALEVWHYPLFQASADLFNNCQREVMDPHATMSEPELNNVRNILAELHCSALGQLLQCIWNSEHGTRQLIREKLDSAATAYRQGQDKAQAELPFPVVSVSPQVVRTQIFKLVKLLAMIDTVRQQGAWPVEQNARLLELTASVYATLGYIHWTVTLTNKCET